MCWCCRPGRMSSQQWQHHQQHQQRLQSPSAPSQEHSSLHPHSQHQSLLATSPLQTHHPSPPLKVQATGQQLRQRLRAACSSCSAWRSGPQRFRVTCQTSPACSGWICTCGTFTTAMHLTRYAFHDALHTLQILRYDAHGLQLVD
jgi:hypothetical protein